VETLFSYINSSSFPTINSEEIKQKIESRLKTIGLKCYLLQNQGNFISMKIDNLKERFELDEKTIKKEVNLLIFNGVLNARWSKTSLEFLQVESSSYLNENLKFKKNIEVMEYNLRQISENNLLLLEAGMKANNGTEKKIVATGGVSASSTTATNFNEISNSNFIEIKN